jgi:glycosyltransferase involved in cell wall biosynthesis
MKIAIFQNFLDNIGGAEVVGLTLARELNAEIYTTNIDREKIASMGFADVTIHSIGNVPVNAPFRQQAVLWRFRRLKLKDKYDFFIINGDWAVSAAINNKPNLWYVNATIREIWDLHKYVRETLIHPLKRPLFDLWSIYNRYLNIKHVGHVDTIISNSTFTQERVKKYLNRESRIIYPPTQTKKFHFEKTGDYWLSVNRLIEYKRVDMQLRAFSKLPNEKLIVIGPYEKSRTSQAYAALIEKIKPTNVTLINHAKNFKELADYYANCKGFITTCHKEDYGMTTVEAMSSGKVVIAPNEGGYRETVINGRTGLLIDDIDEEKLVLAIKKISSELADTPKRFKNDCLENVKKFDIEEFMRKIKIEIEKITKK